MATDAAPHALRRVFLVGMPGSGKSTLGRLAAKALNLEFIDVDAELTKRNGVEIATIFEIEGEAGFRSREAALIEELTQVDGVLLATGGGAVLRKENREALRTRGLVIYLRADLDMLDQRTASTPKREAAGKTRPLLSGGNGREKLEALLAERAPLYNEVAHLTFEAVAADKARVARDLVSAIEAHAATPRSTDISS
jgi:shikimate kinase